MNKRKNLDFKSPQHIAMRITEKRREQIRNLASAVYPIIPGSSRGQSFSLKKVAHDTGTIQHFKPQANKQLTLEHYFTEVFRKYPRKPKLIVVKIVKESAVWMANKHRILTPEIRNTIADAMESLGFDIRSELQHIEQPAFQRISIPGDDFRILFDRLELHDLLCGDVKTLFLQGHANDAVRRATELFEKQVKDVSGSPAQFGVSPHGNTLSMSANPIIKVNKYVNEDDKKEQKGFKYLGNGSYGMH